MKCPSCGEDTNRVLESRDVEDSLSIRRRRECQQCDTRFTTYERVEVTHLMIVKKNGNRESYERSKLASGVYRAFEKRPFPAEEIELLISRIEHQLIDTSDGEIPSSQLGEIVMHELMGADDVAYVRFASVYRSFSDIHSFEQELQNLKKSRTSAKS